MPSLKDLKNRIDSVKSTRKITKAMQMVAASKMRRAQAQVEATRPYAAKAWEVLKYFTPINIVGPVNMVNVNQAAWDKLSADIQAKVMEIAAEMEDEMWNLAGDMDRKSRAKLVEQGMNIKPVSNEFRAQLDAIGNQLRAEWAKKAGADAQKILDEYYRITGR